MGLISDVKAMKEVQRIKKGGTTKLSISQITGLITNMMDAKKNLTKETYDEVYALFQEYRKCNTKIEMDIDGYLKTAVDIIKEFDKIAPYEKYSGGNEIEFGFLMKDIRSESKENEEEENKSKFDYSDVIKTKQDKEDLENLLQGAIGTINEEEAVEFLSAVVKNPDLNQEKILKKFDKLAQKLMKKNPAYASFSIPYLVGVLKNNKIINEQKSEQITNEYMDQITKNIMKKSDNTNEDDGYDNIRNFALQAQNNYLENIKIMLEDENNHPLAALNCFGLMMVLANDCYENCDDKDIENYNISDDNGYYFLHFEYMIWSNIFKEVDEKITEYQVSKNKSSYGKYAVLFFETISQYTDLIRGFNHPNVIKPKFKVFYETFGTDIDELFEIGTFPNIFELSDNNVDRLNELIEKNRNGEVLDPRLNKL